MLSFNGVLPPLSTLALLLAVRGVGAEIGTNEWRVVHTHQHDRTAFTQGILYDDGHFYESTGLYGRSSIRHTSITGDIKRKRDVPSNYFAEGLSLHPTKRDILYQLTWKAQVVFTYDKNTFTPGLQYQLLPRQEGWGLTEDGSVFYLTNGSSWLSIRDAETFEEIRAVSVLDKGIKVNNLNEIEYIKGFIWANIWQSNVIVRIDPTTGSVVNRWDFSALVADARIAFSGIDVLNGIVYDKDKDRIWVTGKLWSQLYEIELLGTAASATPVASTPVPSQSIIVTPSPTPTPSPSPSTASSMRCGAYSVLLWWTMAFSSIVGVYIMHY